jgi:hypothetical protein
MFPEPDFREAAAIVTPTSHIDLDRTGLADETAEGFPGYRYQVEAAGVFPLGCNLA